MEKYAGGYFDLKGVLQKKNASWKGFFSSFYRNPSFLLVLAGNIAIFFIPGMDIRSQAYTLLWIYLLQSLMIGLLHFFKLLFYRFAAASRPKDWKSPKALAVFFLFHYGFFHFVYAFFLPASRADWQLVLQGAAIFSFSIIISSIQQFSKENSGKLNANDFMFIPYLRIVPIHFAIILGGFFSAVSGHGAAIVIVLVAIKIAMELLLEYAQEIGLRFSDFGREK